MKKAWLVLFLFIHVKGESQDKYWQQEVKYAIDATLNETEKTVTGFETIVYKNNAPVSLDFIWFHIWPNAYKNDSTALMKQIANDPDRKKKLENVTAGSIEGLSFKINGRIARTELHPNPNYIDIIKVVLPAPLTQGDSITITTPFLVRLPSYFSRSGYEGDQFMICQWYPKPAVFDKDGWHEIPYLDMGEFYSEFATYDVNLTLPSSYVVGATGELQSAAELDMYKKLGDYNAVNKNTKPALYKSIHSKATKTLRYHAVNVPDFAWFADKNFVIQYDTVAVYGNKITDAFTFYHNRENTIWNNSINYVKDAVRKYSDWIGAYQYPVVQVVEGPKNNSSGGMEYPMITLITSPEAKAETLDGVIAHEIGHNWFMSMLGTNERAHTWMDEGLNTYYQFRYEAEKYRSNSIFGETLPANIKALPLDKFQEAIYVSIQQIPMQPPMSTPIEGFSGSQEYGLVSYVKTALWMYLLESAIGKEKVDLAVQHYFRVWKNKHPQPGDMQAAFEEAIGADLSKFFELIHKEGKFE